MQRPAKRPRNLGFCYLGLRPDSPRFSTNTSIESFYTLRLRLSLSFAFYKPHETCDDSEYCDGEQGMKPRMRICKIMGIMGGIMGSRPIFYKRMLHNITSASVFLETVACSQGDIFQQCLRPIRAHHMAHLSSQKHGSR